MSSNIYLNLVMNMNNIVQIFKTVVEDFNLVDRKTEDLT